MEILVGYPSIKWMPILFQSWFTPPQLAWTSTAWLSSYRTVPESRIATE